MIQQDFPINVQHNTPPDCTKSPRQRHLRQLAAALIGLSALAGSPAQAAESEAKGYLVDWSAHPAVLDAIESGDPALTSALEQLVAEANDALETPIVPVTAGKEDGKRLAPSGDPHDYVSLSPYWWPDPDSPDGLPYIRRDGQTNPERNEYDTPKLGAMSEAVRTMGFAYFMTGDERYAQRAGEHLRAWFVDPETRMNPSLRFGQSVPGVSIGRAVGIIDTNRLRWIPDAVEMISVSPSWSAQDDAAMNQWFSDYLDWLITSDLGQAESRAPNNHGTWHSAQACLYAVATGRDDVARQLIEKALTRMNGQIEPDGSQPHELARTKALDYTEFNIRAYLDLATYGRRVGIDVLGHTGDEGQSVLTAIDWAIPYFTGEQDWPYKQIVRAKRPMYYQTLVRAGNLTGDAKYYTAADLLRGDLPASDQWMPLIVPPTPMATEISSGSR